MASACASTKQRMKIKANIKRNWMLYIFLVPCILYIIIFNYLPLYGIQIAFKNFTPALGIWGSKWVGLKHFTRFFESYQFLSILKNTLELSIYSLLAGFPMPIILALILNYTTSIRLKKIAQTATYAPHFISTVVMVGMLMVFLAKNGVVNQIMGILGFSPSLFMGEPALFKSIYVWSGVWQNAGWGSIIYMATLASVSPELHEAAIVDGANKLHRIWHIDIPSILPTAVILLILNLGSIMSVGFEKAYLMQNDINIEEAEIISTYVYKVGLLGAQYSYSTAIGLFNNLVNFILLVVVNSTAKKLTSTSLW